MTSTSSGYSAAYDAAGNLICRALTTTTTCSGASPSGQQLSYDAQGRLSIWQDQPTSPTTTVNYLYDGSGHRVATQSTVNGTTTLTAYIGSIEEVQTTGSSTQTTTYYSVGGKRVAADVNGTFYYFGYDALGSLVAVLNSTGSLVGAQLYGPYGSSRYTTGILPTSIGFTGQQSDSTTGLDYYVARYYDPVIGAFLSVDSVQGNNVGMDPYAYVSGNPETLTDPTGHCAWWDVACGVEAVGQAVQATGEEIASNVGGFFGDLGEALSGFGEALSGFGEALSPWLGPIGIVASIAISMTQSTKLGCGCVTPSTRTHQSARIGHTIDVANPKKVTTADALEKIRAKSEAAKNTTTKEGKERQLTNYGGVYLQLGNVVNGVFVPVYGYISPPLASYESPYHVEDNATDWAVAMTNYYQSLPGHRSISAVRLDIYTFQAPCPLCANYYRKSSYAGDIAAHTGILDVDVRIWTSKGNENQVNITPAKY